MKNSAVCVDASLAFNMYLPQPLAKQAVAVWERWKAQEIRLLAPRLFLYEAAAILRGNVHFGVLTAQEGEAALIDLLRQPTEYPHIPDLHVRAYRLATEFQRPRAYDTHYLVVAQDYDCECWTADKKLVNAVQHKLPWVKFVGDYTIES